MLGEKLSSFDPRKVNLLQFLGVGQFLTPSVTIKKIQTGPLPGDGFSLSGFTVKRGADGRPLLGAILVQESENVIGPDIGSKVAKGVAVPRGVAVGGINL